MEHQQKTRNRTTSKTMKKKAKSPTDINKLPEDLFVEIAAQLVSSSALPFADLYNLKESCKTFYMASKDRMVEKCIALEREILTLNWKAKYRHQCMPILKSCANAENVEACFILALVNIIEHENIYKGVELLKKASSNGYKAALYMMNILIVRLQKQKISVDMNSHNVIKSYQSTFNDYDQLKWCREKVLHVIRQMTWKKWQAIDTGNMRRCKNSDCGISGWDDNKYFCSDACKWNHEYFELCTRM